MKKTIITILVWGFLILGMTGCETNEYGFDIGRESNIEIVEKGVSLTIKEDTLTKTGATLILKNNSDVDVQYGNPYGIEIKKDGEWHVINVEVSFTLPAFVLKSNEVIELELNWEHEYGALASGDYRIVKSIDIEKEDGKFETFYVAAEFTIE